MAVPPIVTATLQGASLAALSNILAQLISTPEKTAFQIDWIPVFQFLIFSVVNTPPNILWQEFLESTYPARRVGPKGKEGGLSMRNTIVKFVLDQTVGAAFNTLLFSLYIHSIDMAMPDAPRITSLSKAVRYWIEPGVIDFSAVNGRAVLDAALAEFWTIFLAGAKLWPAVSLINFTLIRTVEGRNLVSCFAGLGWGIYMSMIAARN